MKDEKMQEYFPEVLAAAKWWADILSTADIPQDNGDGFQSALASMCRGGVAPLGADERSVFERVLRDGIQEHVIANGWERAKDQPGWGSACRYVGVDYGPTCVLSAAAHVVTGEDRKQQARVSLLWPIKTGMWINPGEVKVSHGYRAEAVSIYRSDEPMTADARILKPHATDVDRLRDPRSSSRPSPETQEPTA